MNCRMCRGELSQRFNLADTPIANNLQDHPYGGDYHPLNLMECQDCGHVQLDRAVVDFNHYPYRTPKAQQPYLEGVATNLRNRFPRAEKVVEIGSNNGLNTEILKRAGFASVIGVDPAGTHWAAWKVPFDENAAQRIYKRVGPIDLVVANNVFAHIDDLDAVFRGIDFILDEHGAVIIEVQDFQKSLERGYFDMIYHEHLDQHRPGPWKSFLERHNLNLSAVEHTPTHGGSIRLTATRHHKTDWFDASVDWDDYREKVDRVKQYVRNVVPHNSAIWGATAKITTMIYHCGIQDRFRYCVDSTPEKQGKYLPGTDIQIVPDFLDKPNRVLLGAWNYECEFKRQFPDLKSINPYRIMEF